LILPITGFLTDRVNPLKLLLGSSVAAIVCLIPIYQLAAVGSVSAIVVAQLWLALITAFYVGPKSVVMYNLFETRIRFTGVSFGYAAGVAIFGGLTPIINKLLDHLGYSPALFGMMCGVISAVPLITLWRNSPKKYDL
jgi:MHS family proline/betaine transporter-like MFS transporter